MTEIALKVDSYLTTITTFVEFINSSEKEKTENSSENLLIKLINLVKKKHNFYSKRQDENGFWSKYNLEFQNDFQKVRATWLQGINPQTRQIRNLETLNQGYQEFKAFLEKHWLDLSIEDRQHFKKYAQQIQEITVFAKHKFTERNSSDFIELILVLSKLISLKRLMMLIINFILLKKSSQKFENSNNSIFNFIDTQADFANTILNLSKLYPDSWIKTTTAVIEIIKEVEQINDRTDEKVVLEIINKIKALNTVLEENYYQELKNSDDENNELNNLDNLENLYLKVEELFTYLKLNSINNYNLLVFQLEVLSDLIFSLVNGQRINELVWEIRNRPRTSEEELEIKKILNEALNGES